MTNTETAALAFELRDEVPAKTRQGYQLVRTYRVGADVLQVTVAVDSYEHQSWAAAKLLTSDRKWTTLVSLPPSRWFAGCASYVAVSTDREIYRNTEPLSDELLQRALDVLA